MLEVLVLCNFRYKVYKRRSKNGLNRVLVLCNFRNIDNVLIIPYELTKIVKDNMVRKLVHS